MSLCHVAMGYIHTGLYFLLGPEEVVYSNGATVFLAGAPLPGPLVCVTTNVTALCCRSEDNTNVNGGRNGEWYHDNTVVANNATSQVMGSNLYRSRDKERVNLQARDGRIPPGLYRCDVLDEYGDNVSATLTVTNDSPITTTTTTTISTPTSTTTTTIITPSIGNYIY